MELKDLTEKLKRFNDERNWDDGLTPEDVAKSIVIEGAELLEHFQWDSSRKSRGTMKEKDLEAVGEEIADVFIYTIRISYLMGYDLEKIVLAKIEKNAKKYPPKDYW